MYNDNSYFSGMDLELTASQSYELLSQKIDSLETRLSEVIIGNILCLKEGLYVDLDKANQAIDVNRKYLARLCLEESLVSNNFFDSFYHMHKALYYDRQITPEGKIIVPIRNTFSIDGKENSMSFETKVAYLEFGEDESDIDSIKGFITYVKAEQDIYHDLAFEIYKTYHDDYKDKDGYHFKNYLFSLNNQNSPREKMKLSLLDHDMRFFDNYLCSYVDEEKKDK